MSLNGFSLRRAKIVSLVHNNPMTVSELCEKSGIPRTSLYHHLEHLKRNGVIYEKKLAKNIGQPVIITTNRASPLPLMMIEFFEKFSKFENKKEKK